MEKRQILILLVVLSVLELSSAQDYKQLFTDACARNDDFHAQALTWSDTLTCQTTVLNSAQTNIDLCQQFAGDPFTGIAMIAIAKRLISQTDALQIQFDSCKPSELTTESTSTVAQTTTTSIISTLAPTTTDASDVRSSLMPNITDALVSLVALYNSTQSSSALACCKDPIVADIELLVNLAMTIKENLFLQSYPISYNFIVGLNANFLQLQFNWTQCNVNTAGDCCNDTTTTTSTTSTSTLATTTTSTSTVAPTTTSTSTVAPTTTSTSTVAPTTTSTSTVAPTTTSTSTLAPTTTSTSTEAPTTTSTSTLAPTTTSTSTLAPTTTSTTTLAPTTTSTTTLAPTTTSTSTVAPTTTTTTPLAPTTTTLKPANTSICMKQVTFKSKKCCLVSGSYTYVAAQAKCFDNGMYLAPVVTSADLTEFNTNVIGNLINQLLSPTTNKFWVNGQLVGSDWISTTSISETITASIVAGSGSCLNSASSLLQIQPGSYKLYQNSCSSTFSAMCWI